MIFLVGILFALALGGAAFAFTGGNEVTQKRVAAVAKAGPNATRGRGANTVQDTAQKRKNVAVMLKDMEKNRAAKKERPTLRRQLERAGYPKASPRTFWML